MLSHHTYFTQSMATPGLADGGGQFAADRLLSSLMRQSRVFQKSRKYLFHYHNTAIHDIRGTDRYPEDRSRW